MTKDYNQFKREVKTAIAILEQQGKKLTAKRWAKQSPFQKARYKPEYVFPEVWLYVSSDNRWARYGGQGIVINAEEHDTSAKIIKYLANII